MISPEQLSKIIESLDKTISNEDSEELETHLETACKGEALQK